MSERHIDTLDSISINSDSIKKAEIFRKFTPEQVLATWKNFGSREWVKNIINAWKNNIAMNSVKVWNLNANPEAKWSIPNNSIPTTTFQETNPGNIPEKFIVNWVDQNWNRYQVSDNGNYVIDENWEVIPTTTRS